VKAVSVIVSDVIKNTLWCRVISDVIKTPFGIIGVWYERDKTPYGVTDDVMSDQVEI
jgi:hypothetical protein